MLHSSFMLCSTLIDLWETLMEYSQFLQTVIRMEDTCDNNYWEIVTGVLKIHHFDVLRYHLLHFYRLKCHSSLIKFGAAHLGKEWQDYLPRYADFGSKCSAASVKECANHQVF